MKVIKSLCLTLLTIVLTITSVYATNKTSVATDNQTHTDQYKLDITADANVLNKHVEILPDENGDYWIPKNYKVKVTGDYKDGFQQSNYSDAITMSEAKQVALGSEVAPPTKVDQLEERIAALENRLSTDVSNYSLSWLVQPTSGKYYFFKSADCLYLDLTAYKASFTMTESGAAFYLAKFNHKLKRPINATFCHSNGDNTTLGAACAAIYEDGRIMINYGRNSVGKQYVCNLVFIIPLDVIVD